MVRGEGGVGSEEGGKGGMREKKDEGKKGWGEKKGEGKGG